MLPNVCQPFIHAFRLMDRESLIFSRSPECAALTGSKTSRVPAIFSGEDKSARNLRFAGRPLFVIDGSQALRKGIKAVHSRALIQRCLVHLERSVYRIVSHKHYGRIAELFAKLRLAQGSEEGRHALLALKQYLRKINYKAWKCVQSIGAEAITIHLLNVPNSLHTTFLSTNNIENIFNTARLKIGRVKRWNPESGMGERWMASALLDAEKGFNRITGYEQLPELIAALTLHHRGEKTMKTA